MSLKILQVVSCFYPAWAYGGPLKVAYDVSRKLVERGHEVTVYTSDMNNGCLRTGSRIKEVDGIQVHYFKNISPLVLKEMKQFITPEMIPVAKREIRGFDVVHLHEYRTFQNIIVQHYAKKYRVPYVLQAHGSLPRTIAKQELKWIYDVFFGNRLLRDTSKVIAVNQMEAEQYKSMGMYNEKIEIIPHGIDLAEFTDLPKRGTFRKKCGINSEEKLILYIGRLHEIKGIDILMKAYACLAKELHSTKLVITGPDDGYLSTYKELATQLGVERKILFTGPLYGRDKLEVYVDADMFVLPSRYEIFGMTILEACACAKPVVATDVCGAARGIIMNGSTGFLVQPENVLELTEALRRLLTNEAESKKMGMQARERVMNMFSIQNVVVKIENLYKEILR